MANGTQAQGGGVLGGELQTLISTLQSTNVQLGGVIKAIQGLNTSVLSGAMGGSSTSAAAGSATALPATPAGYISVTIPGVGARKMPYYN